MLDAHLDASACPSRSGHIARRFRRTALPGLLGMAILTMPLQVPAAVSLPTPLDITQIQRLAYPGGVLPSDVPGTADGGQEQPMPAPSPAADATAIDASDAADSSSESPQTHTAARVGMPDVTDAPVAPPPPVVSGAPAAVPAGVPSPDPASLNREAIASLASGETQAADKPAEPPRVVTVPGPGGAAEPQPLSHAVAPGLEPQHPAPPPVAVPDGPSPQQAMPPEAAQRTSLPQQPSAPAEGIEDNRPEHVSVMPRAAVPQGWAPQQGMSPGAMPYYWPQQQPVPQAVHPYGRPVQLPITQQQIDILLNVFGPALQR